MTRDEQKPTLSLSLSPSPCLSQGCPKCQSMILLYQGCSTSSSVDSRRCPCNTSHENSLSLCLSLSLSRSRFRISCSRQPEQKRAHSPAKATNPNRSQIQPPDANHCSAPISTQNTSEMTSDSTHVPPTPLKRSALGTCSTSRH